ncbi:MAG TPA: SRPBCC family protein [Conexibacter sp.]|jgi:carbon monoxide dehydrogenase subunit G
MRFEDGFTVTAPVEEVWSALLDVERVAPCMPGAQVLERVDDDTFRVAIRVNVGPVSMRYRGEVEVVERDDAAHRATMRVKAKESRGQGTADANVHMALTDDGHGTAAAMETEVQMSGKVAAMGQGVIAGVSARLVETFANNLAAMLEGDSAAASSPAPPRPAAATPAPRADAPPSPPPPPAAAAPAPRADAPPSPPSPPPPRATAPPAPTPGPAPPRPEPVAPVLQPSEPETSLPIGKVIVGVVIAKLRDPRALAGVGTVAVLLAGLIGFRLGRARR